NTMSTITSRKMSSGPPIFGILHVLTGQCPVLRTVYGGPSPEQPGQQRYEERDDHQEGESRQIADGQHERELSLDVRSGLQGPRTLGRSERVAQVLQHRQRTPAEVARSFKAHRELSH